MHVKHSIVKVEFHFSSDRGSANPERMGKARFLIHFKISPFCLAEVMATVNHCK